MIIQQALSSPLGSLLFGKGQSFSTVENTNTSNITRRKVSSENYDFEKLLLLCFKELTVPVTDKTGLGYCWYQFDLEFHVIHIIRVVLVYRHIAQLTTDLY